MSKQVKIEPECKILLLYTKPNLQTSQKTILSPKIVQKMDFFHKFPTEKVATHLKIFLGVIRNIWHGQTACYKKKQPTSA